MSYQKPHVSVKESCSNHHYRHSSLRKHAREEHERPKSRKRRTSESSNNKKKCRDEDSAERKTSGDRKQVIIKHRLKELDKLKRKVKELQKALVEQKKSERLLSNTSLSRRSSSCFSCMRGGERRRSNREDIIELYIKQNTLTDDGFSTEAVFNSSRESLPDEEEDQHYRKHRQKCRGHHQKRIRHRTQERYRKEQTRYADDTKDDEPVKLDKNMCGEEHKMIYTQNRIVLPDLFNSATSNTSVFALNTLKADGHIVKNLSRKIEVQNLEIQEIKASLKECLTLLKERTESTRHEDNVNTTNLGDDYLNINNGFFGKPRADLFLNSLIREQEIVNYFKTKQRLDDCTCKLENARLSPRASRELNKKSSTSSRRQRSRSQSSERSFTSGGDYNGNNIEKGCKTGKYVVMKVSPLNVNKVSGREQPKKKKRRRLFSFGRKKKKKRDEEDVENVAEKESYVCPHKVCCKDSKYFECCGKRSSKQSLERVSPKSKKKNGGGKKGRGGGGGRAGDRGGSQEVVCCGRPNMKRSSVSSVAYEGDAFTKAEEVAACAPNLCAKGKSSSKINVCNCTKKRKPCCCVRLFRFLFCRGQ